VPAILFNAACPTQDLPDGGLGAWQAYIGTVECGVAMDIVEDRFWSWNTLQVLRRLQTNLQDVLHDGWLGCDGGWWRVTGTRAGVQSHNVTGIGLAQPLEPFAHPGA